MQLHQVELSGYRRGKSAHNIAIIKFCIRQNKKLVLGTSNQIQTINDLRPHFNKGTLFSIVGNWGVMIHERK